MIYTILLAVIGIFFGLTFLTVQISKLNAWVNSLGFFKWVLLAFLIYVIYKYYPMLEAFAARLNPAK